MKNSSAITGRCSAASLSGFFDGLTAEERAGIDAVAMDMSGAYLSAVRRALGPDANERITFIPPSPRIEA